MFAGMLTIFVVRERGPFWASTPSRTLLLAIVADIALAVLISWHGMPGLYPLPLTDILSLLAMAFLFNLLVNDSVKMLVLRYYGRD